MKLLPSSDIRQDADRAPPNLHAGAPTDAHRRRYARVMGGTQHGTGIDEPVEPFEPGATVAIREIWNGRVWYARPATVVRDEPNLTMLLVPPHVTAKEPVDAAGAPLRIPTTDWTLPRHRTRRHLEPLLRLPGHPVLGDPRATRPPATLREYYVNLQTPLERSPTGFDTVEHLLDVTIPPDRSTWAWKDEDELAEAIDGGLFTDEDAAWFRYWGERAVEHVLLREPPVRRGLVVVAPRPRLARAGPAGRLGPRARLRRIPATSPHRAREGRTIRPFPMHQRRVGYVRVRRRRYGTPATTTPERRRRRGDPAARPRRHPDGRVRAVPRERREADPDRRDRGDPADVRVRVADEGDLQADTAPPSTCRRPRPCRTS